MLSCPVPLAEVRKRTRKVMLQDSDMKNCLQSVHWRTEERREKGLKVQKVYPRKAAPQFASKERIVSRSI